LEENVEKYLSLLGRLLISALFLISGYLKITHWHDIAGLLASMKIPFVPVALSVIVLVEIGGALCIMTGYQARIAACVQFLYLIPVTFMMHNFWAFQGAQQQDQMAHFLKNLGLMGGLLFIVAYGAGVISVDASRRTEAFASATPR
jgi:putative oxidoreductase